MADKYGLQFAFVPIDNEALKAAPVPAAPVFPVFACPESPNCRVEVVYIGIACAGVLVVDAADVILLDLVFHDASADTNTTFMTGAAGAAGDLKAAQMGVIRETTLLSRGLRTLDPGDTIVAPLTIVTPTTAGDGYYFVVAYRVKEWNGE